MNTIKDREALLDFLLLLILHSFVLLPILHLLMDINNIQGKGLLFFFFILTHLSAFLFKKWWLYYMIQIILFSIYIYILFPPENDALRFRDWVAETWSLGAQQWDDLLGIRLIDVPVLLTMSAIFLLITILTFLLLRFHLALPSLFTGLIYLMVLHTFTSRPVLSYLILLTGFGFLLIAVSQLLPRSDPFSFTWNSLAVILAILVLTGLSYAALDPLESSQEWVETKSNAYQKKLDERGFFDWINARTGGLGFRRTGMGTNTDRLGGRLQQDFSSVFRAYTKRPNYWKVMNRTEYTGLGWKSENSDPQRSIPSTYTFRKNDTLNVDPFSDTQDPVDFQTETLSEARLEWFDELTYIAYPYGLRELKLDETEADLSLRINETSSYLTVQSETDGPDGYTLTYDRTFPDRLEEEALRRDDGWRETLIATYREETSEVESVDESDDDDLFYQFFEQELQLPTGLPQRVTELAEEITAGLETEYDMVRAVESYLKEEGGYRYSLLDSEDTPQDADYVDHFLFESQVGYCDNFSTAMTVLLRTIGIPARWTRGFTPGSQIVTEDEESYFLVDNSNAHSWPEVFFPSYGWVPFEPSPSFASPVTNPVPVEAIRGETYSFDDQDTLEIDEAERENTDGNASDELNSADELAGLEGQDGSGQDENAGESSISQSLSRRLRAIFYRTSLVIAVTASLILILRWRLLLWLPRLLIRTKRLSRKKVSWMILKLYHLKHKPSKGQTVQMYMNEWKPFMPEGSEIFDQFTELADRAFYGPEGSSAGPFSGSEQTVMIEMLHFFPFLPHVDARQDRVL